jgi:hypothetical protein
LTEPITHIFDPRDPTLSKQLHEYKSQNWDIFTVPKSLVMEYQKLGILTLKDSTENLIISLSYGGIDPAEFYEAIHNRNRHNFFKTSEKQGINHTLYRIIDGRLSFVHHLQKSIPYELVRFTGCYIDRYYHGELFGITTNAYPDNMINKNVINEHDEIPHQEIALTKLNKMTGLYEDLILNNTNVLLEDRDSLYYKTHIEWRDPSVYQADNDFADFVFCARDSNGKSCVGRGRVDFVNWTMTTLPPIIIPEAEDYLYLECPQIFSDLDDNQWLLVSVGFKDGSHCQCCWYQKDNQWIKVNGHGKLTTEFPESYQSYGGKFTKSDNKVRYSCWLADQYGMPSSIVLPTEVIFDYDNGSCSLKPFESVFIEK